MKLNEETRLAFKLHTGKSLDKRLFKIESRQQAENLIESITEKDPIKSQRLANTYWHDHLVRIGVRK